MNVISDITIIKSLKITQATFLQARNMRLTEKQYNNIYIVSGAPV